MKLTFHFLLVSLLITGCTCSLEEAEKLVGACEKQKEIVQGPPEEIFITMPKIAAPSPTLIEAESWTDEMIREDPVGYEETLWNDILRFAESESITIDYINRLEVARARLEAQAKTGGEDNGEQPE